MSTALQCRQIHCIFYVHYQIETFSATPPGGVQQKQKKEENCKYPLQEVGLTGYQKSEKSDIAQHCTRVESLDFGKANRQI